MYIMLLLLNIIIDILNTKRRSNIAPIAKINNSLRSKDLKKRRLKILIIFSGALISKIMVWTKNVNHNNFFNN